MLEAKECNVLVKGIMKHGFNVHVKVIGPSMFPFIKAGDRLLIKPGCAGELSPGDIALFQRGEQFIVHRLIKKTDSMAILTKGDNLGNYDTPVAPDKVLGRVIQIERPGIRLCLTGWSGSLFARLIASFGRVHFRGQVRVTRLLNRLWWAIGGRRFQ